MSKVQPPENIWAYDDGAHLMAFDFDNTNGGAVKYVRADRIAALEAQLAEEQRAVEMLVSWAAANNGEPDLLLMDWRTTKHQNGTLENGIEALKSLVIGLEAQLAERVKAKVLEWVTPLTSLDLSRAETIVGDYRVWTHPESGGVWFWSLLGGADTAQGEGTRNECFAAAQADFDRRTLSALEATPPAPKDGETVRLYEPYPGAFDPILGPDTPPPAPKVTDEMVERAYAGAVSSGACQDTAPGDLERIVLAALTAALSGDAS